MEKIDFPAIKPLQHLDEILGAAMIKMRHYLLFMLAPAVILLVIMFTSAGVLEIFHFVQEVDGVQYKFAINREDISKFQNILITSNELSHFSGFNWIIRGKEIKEDVYLSFQKKDRAKNAAEPSPGTKLPDFTLSTGKERIPGYFGVPFHLDDEKKTGPVRQGPSLRIDYFPKPWYLVLWVLGCAVVNIISIRIFWQIARKRILSLKPLVYTAAVTNILLVFRLLFAYKAYRHYPFSEKSYQLALPYALFLVPLFLLICFILQTYGLFDKLGNLIKKTVKENYSRQLLSILLMFIVPVIFRLAAGLGREATHLGTRFALSIFFVPYLTLAGATVLFFTFYWYFRLKNSGPVDTNLLNRLKITIHDKFHTICSTLAVLILLAIYIFIGRWDKGLLLLYIPPFVILCAICFALLETGKGRSKWRWVPVGLSYLGLIGVFLFLLFPGKSILLVHNLSNLKVAAGIDAREINDSFELQRILTSIDSPLVLHNFSKATWTQMEEFDKVKQYLEYSTSNNGYFRVVIDKSLGIRALHDYVTAVFFIPEFGTFWMIFALLIFSSFALLPMLLRRKLPIENKYGFSFLIFISIGLVLFYSAVYMIGGNLSIFPFSGKNVYLWGIDSRSDMVEAAILLGMFVIAYAQSRDSKRPKTAWGKWGHT